MKAVAAALGTALILLSSSPGRTDEGSLMVRVKCDARRGTAFIDSMVVWNGENKPEASDAKLYDIDKLPQYAQHKPAQPVCDLGKGRRVLLSAGTDNATVSINTTTETVGRIFFSYNVYSYEIAFSDDDVSITECTQLSFKPRSKECETNRFTTRFSPTSTNAASFDCAKAGTVAEHLICDDAQLAEYDRAIAAAYRDVLGRVADKASLASNQSLWRSGDRDSCVHGKSTLFPADLEEAKECMRGKSRSRLGRLLGRTPSSNTLSDLGLDRVLGKAPSPR